jgi:UDP-N-acetylmuramoyl-tripeptide--D-alanyl-D-alanine ligase
MPTFLPNEVHAAISGQILLQGPQPAFTGVSTDTRAIQPGDLFFAIRGERFNGHDHLEIARERGAAGAVVCEDVPGVRPRHSVPGPWHLFEVTDTLYAYGQLAHAYRRRFRIPIIGITGSAGKTTTKEMTAAILAQGRTVLKSELNYNNEIGVPRTLFELYETHQAAVLEFGMRGPGQIGYLAGIARPNIGLITNVGLTHVELLGSREAIALAKAELLDVMSPRALALLPAGDPCYPLLREHARGQVMTFGEDPTCDLWTDDLAIDDTGCARMTMHWRDTAIPVALTVPGRHQAWNALAAALAALAAGARPEHVTDGLSSYAPIVGRMQVHRAPGGFTVIDDTYNANPDAMRATLRCLAEMPGRRKVAILGDMLELGAHAEDEHRAIGALAAELGIDAVHAVGELARGYLTDARAHWHPDPTAAAAAARDEIEEGDVVLVKGSRSMHMEAAVAALVSSEL